MVSLEEVKATQSFCYVSSDDGCISESFFNIFEVLLVMIVSLIFSFHHSITSTLSAMAKSLVKTKASPEVLRLGNELRRLKSELALLSPTSDFSAYCKTERALNKTLEHYDAAVYEDNKRHSSPARIDMVVKILSQGFGLLLLHVVSGIYVSAMHPFCCAVASEYVSPFSVCMGCGRLWWSRFNTFTCVDVRLLVLRDFRFKNNFFEIISQLMPRHPRLPESGIYTEEGFLFHHSTPQPLTRDEIERLREHDIPYEPRSRFTPAEDEQIRKNWKRFAAKHNLDYELAPSYAGCPGFKILFETIDERITFNKTTTFWPKMCRNLPHRSATQVRSRIGVLFDAAILKGHANLAYSKTHQWTAQDTEKLLRYYREYGMSATAIKKIGKKMKLPANLCQNHLRSILARTGPIPDHLRKKLWVIVTKQTASQNGRGFDRIVSRDIRKGLFEDKKQYDHLIPWNKVAQQMVYSDKMVKKTWHSLLKTLQSNCTKQKESGKSSKESWKDTLREVFYAVPPVSCEDYSRFLQILCEFTPPDTLYDACSQKLYNWESIKSRLEEEGIVGFYSGGREEHDYLFRRTQKICRRVHQLLFRRLKLPYTLKERMHILSLAYDYQCEFAPCCDSDNNEDAGDSDLPQRYRFKNLTLKNHGFPTLNRRPVVEALVVYSLSHFDDWIPPTALKKYVKSVDVLKMFPEGKNNSELIRQSDIDAAVSFLDLDVGSESSSESEVESGSRDGNESVASSAEGTSGQKRLTSAESTATATAESNGLQSHTSGISSRKRHKKDVTIGIDETVSRVPKITGTMTEEGHQEGSDLEIVEVRKSSNNTFKLHRASELEKKGIAGLLKAFSPKKKRLKKI
ncbi:hypothetical protein GCK32_006069 [Trichostrongylus colubriformis]|uniref:Myb-like domain-containing protein n=1 Tax=Trichostrongylus colubriformis TaxID=6319 RepID=A0AAN8IED0_TRICO